VLNFFFFVGLVVSVRCRRVTFVYSALFIIKERHFLSEF
jgi:hypothetical protein